MYVMELVGPGDVPQANDLKELQTSLTSTIDAKRFFAALANLDR